MSESGIAADNSNTMHAEASGVAPMAEASGVVPPDDASFKDEQIAGQNKKGEKGGDAAENGGDSPNHLEQTEADTPLDYSTIPRFPPSVKASNLHLPSKYFMFEKLNKGFQVPYYMSSSKEISKIRPPEVVKTWDQRFSELSPEHQETFLAFQEKVKSSEWYEESKIDEWCCLRYCVARDYDINKAYAMLEKSIRWRNETGADEWECEECKKNPNKHMSQFVGWDKKHRPVLFMSMRWGPERKNPLRHMVAAFNHMIKLMPVGVEKWVCMTDFATYSHLRDSNPTMGLSVIRTIQDHYPERLGKMIIINPPGLFWGLYKLFYPAIDPVTRTKVEFLYTEDTPSVYDSFPKLFPQHLRFYLYDSYDRSKHDLPAQPRVWVPNPHGYPKNSEERKQQLKDKKQAEKVAKELAKEEEKRAKAAEKAAKEAEKKDLLSSSRREEKHHGDKKSDALNATQSSVNPPQPNENGAHDAAPAEKSPSQPQAA